jgi:membrane protease YdiL (CAAX protease family)
MNLDMPVYHPFWFYLITLGSALTLCPVATYFNSQKELIKFQFPLLLIALSVPCITALCMIYGSKNGALISDFQHRLTLFKMSAPSLLFILFFMPCVIYLATGISLLFGHSSEQFSLAREISMMKGWAIFGIVIQLLLAPLIEELGWRGYGVDSLRAHFNLFNTSVLFGILWAIWHLPAFFVRGSYQNGLWNLGPLHVINFFVSVFVIAILMNWIYYKTDRSIPALILFHAMLNLSSMAFRTEPLTKCIATVILCVSAVTVIACDREYFFN